MGRDILPLWKSQESRDSYTYIKQNKLSTKDYEKRPKKPLYNNKGANPSGDYKINKYVPKIGAPQYIRRILTNLKGEQTTM